MIFRTITGILFFLLLLQTPTNAQEIEVEIEDGYPETTHSLGVAAGRTIGLGLSYRYWPNKLGVQATFGPIKNDYQTQISAGVTFLYQMVEANPVNLFFYQGNHFRYDEERYSHYIYPTGSEEEHTIDRFYNFGVGLGLEVIILKRVSFNLMGGYGVYNNFDEIGITGETGLYYNF